MYVITVKTRCGLDLISEMAQWTVMNQKIVSQNVIQSQHMKGIVKVVLWFISNVVSVTIHSYIYTHNSYNYKYSYIQF